MKSKDLLKKVLPVAIAVVVVALIAVLIFVLTQDKKNPTLSETNKTAAYFNYSDGKITFTNEEAYERAKSEYGLSILIDELDKTLLKDEISKVTAADVLAKATNELFGYDTIKEYIEKSELEDLDENELKEKLEKVISDYIDGSLASTGIKLVAGDITLEKSGEEYQLKLANTTAFYTARVLEAARYNYAYAKIIEKYAEELKAYDEYKENLAKYEEYVAALADYNEGITTVKPEEVEQPTEPSLTIAESKYSTKWDQEHVDAYYAVVIPYASLSEAETALLQNGLVVKTVKIKDAEGVESSKAFWFHYGREVLGENEESAFESSDKDGYDIITKNDYYKDLAQEYFDDPTLNNSASPDLYGAYVLNDDEIKQAIINLYNQYYGSKVIEALPVAATEIAKGEESDFYYAAAEVTALSLLTTASGNKFNEFDAENTDFRKFYSDAVTSSQPKVFWILGKTDEVQWDDATEEAKKAYMANEEIKAELLKAATSTSYINEVLDALRVEKGLIIYDTVLEDDYLSTYTTSEYAKTKKSNKTIVAKVEGLEVTADELFNLVSDRYGVAVALEQYQYQWMFFYAAKNDGELFNKYVDYEKYLSGKPLKDCILDNEDAKAKWEEISGNDGTITNIKNSFASGGYASYGFDASYGWKNFLRDFFSRYYGVSISSNDDLGMYLIYQQIVSDYTAYIAEVQNVDWELVEANYITTLNKYINAVGYHMLICVKDDSGKTVDPKEWTDEQVNAAKDLYARILSLAKDLDKEDVYAFFSALNTAYSSINKYPVDFATGEYIKDNIVNAKGNKKFNYTYIYKDDAQSYDADEFELAYYKSLGLSLTFEDLTTTQGVMVAEFEKGVREMWDKHLADMIENDGTYEEVEIHDETIETSFGYHLYVNKSYNLTAYVSGDDKVVLPSKENIALYQYENKYSTDSDYVAVAKLVADYVEAKQLTNDSKLESAKTAIINAMKKIDLFEVTESNVVSFTETTLYAYTNILSLNSSDNGDLKVDVDDLKNNTLIQTEITNWYSDIDSEYTGSYYYQLAVLLKAYENSAKIKLVGRDVSAKEVLGKYIESYRNYLTFNKGDKERTKTLLEGFGYDALLANLYDEEMTAKYQTLAKTMFEALSDADKAELQEAYDAAKLN